MDVYPQASFTYINIGLPLIAVGFCHAQGYFLIMRQTDTSTIGYIIYIFLNDFFLSCECFAEDTGCDGKEHSKAKNDCDYLVFVNCVCHDSFLLYSACGQPWASNTVSPLLSTWVACAYTYTCAVLF